MYPLLSHLRRAFVASAVVLVARAQAPASAGTGASPANTQSAAAAKGNSADQDWAALTALLAPKAAPGPHARRSLDESRAAHADTVGRLKQAAAAARQFYTAHPTDPRALQARKAEAISLVHSTTGDPAQDKSALATAQSFRADASVPARDRFDVALAMDHQALAQKIAARQVQNPALEEKKLVEQWRTEFGDLPQVEAYAINVARRADAIVAVPMAAQVLQSATAPAQTKAEAKALVARAGLLGTAPSLKVFTDTGESLDLAQLQGKRTILVVWHPREADALQELARFQHAFRHDVQVIYIAVGGTAADASGLSGSLPVPGKSTYVPAELAVDALKIRTMPYIFVLNGAGKLSDFGPVAQSAAILSRAGAISTKHS